MMTSIGGNPDGTACSAYPGDFGPFDGCDLAQNVSDCASSLVAPLN